MPIHPLNFYFKHFEKNRELPGVKKEPMPARERDGMVDMLDLNLRNAMSRDNAPGDLDPIVGQVLTANGGSMTYSVDEEGRHLRTLSSEGERCFLSQSLQTDRGFDLLSYTAIPGMGKTLLCFHADLADPGKDFVQRLDVG
ncbi:hypothetical protein ABS71_12420 [bacterium SCN 62-11]|nr:hypothetical protein [Candidatus Eremiobacteraeota bacterium]ODT65150.1 MAG: hypothetical protein ABS71_12420 [bacterium SCN 62-11]